jgi:hypothetical protein
MTRLIQGINMKRLATVVAALAAIALGSGAGARAEDGFHLFRGDPRLIAPGVAVGVATTGAYFAMRHSRGGVPHQFTELGAFGLATVGCMSLTPLVSGIVVQRELTRREVHVMLANCLVPVIGGWVMDAYFDRHPERDSVPPPKPVKVAHHAKHY